MNKFFSWLGKKAANGIVTGVFFLITIVGITYAISYPSAPPAGETAGGKFSRLFQVCPAGKMLRGFNVDTGIDCIDPPVGPKWDVGAKGDPGTKWDAGATGPTGPAGAAATANNWSANSGGCTGYVYGPPGASFRTIAHDASSMNPLGGYDTWHKISSTGYFSWTASQTGGSSGYVDVLYNGQYVAGVSVNGNCG